MKALKLALCAAAASFAMAGAASAQEAEYSFNVAVTSDYVFRGFSQTDENPALQGGVDVVSGMWYAGGWASNVDFGDSTSAEVDIYAGITPTVGAVSLNLGAIYYGYVNAPSTTDYNFWEFKAAASIPAGPVTLSAAAYYSPEFFGGLGDSLYYEASASISPVDKWTISATAGKQTFDDISGADYGTWNLGVGYAITEAVSVDVRYSDTDLNCTALCDERVAVTLKAVLP